MAVRKAGIQGLYGLEGTVNVQGEQVKKLDILSHDLFVNAIRSSTTASVLVSEEKEEPILIEDPKMQGPYVVAFDPLDGSSNIDCNISVGSIFAIYKRNTKGPATVKDILRPGSELCAAGYCMYGSATQIVLTFGKGAHLFTHDPALGEFILTEENVKIPDSPKKIYSVNEGNSIYWHPPVKMFVENLKQVPYSHRYVGSMVADVHRTILYGGVFVYPSDKKSKTGKLRLLYEANPMALIVEQAGGVALTDNNANGESGSSLSRVLDVQPLDIHQRVGVFLGCKRDIQLLEKAFGN